jgi:hypothetical protein
MADTIDHNFNMKSLIVFANNDFADYTRLPVDVKDRVVIDNTFATRDLVRAMRQESAYYVLVLSRQNARLIEAFNGEVVDEKGGEFPFVNTLFTTDRDKLATNKGNENLIEEFFNNVDKVLQETIKDRQLPVLLATEKRNVQHYMKVADKKDLIFANMSRVDDDEKALNIVTEAWKVVEEIVKLKNSTRISELENAISAGKYLSDYNEIWNAIQLGKGKTLFVKTGLFQPAILLNNVVTIVDKIDKTKKGMVEDIIDEMIEQNMAFGGDVVFVEGIESEQFHNIALITRY